MRFANVKKQERASWFTAIAPKRESMRAAKYWCDSYHLSTRYYYHYTNTRWWFEDDQDALLFSLKWGGR